MAGLDHRKGLGHDAQTVLASLFRHPAPAISLIELRIIRRGGGALQEFIPQVDLTRAVRRAVELRNAGDVYYGVGLRAREAGGKDAVATLPAVWADIDSPEAIVELMMFPLPPTLVINTGTPGHVHAYWFTKAPLRPADAEKLNRRIARALGSDPQAVDAARVLRLPGTLNHKHDPPAEVTMADFTAKYYAVDEISAVLPQIEPPSRQAFSGRVAVDSGGELEAVGTPTEKILDLLQGVAPTGNGWTALCPAHDDQRPSLSITDGDDGRCLLKCFRGCSAAAIVAALGLELADLFEGDDRQGGPQSVAAQLVGLAEQAGVQLFHDPKGQAFAEIPVGERREVRAVGSQGFKRWLRRRLHLAGGRVATATALADAIELLCAKAEFDGPEREVFVRVAQHGDGVLIDLADEEWRALEVLSGQWRVAPRSPVPFIRSGAALSLPVPVGGGSIEELREFLNLTEERDWQLVVAYMVATLSGRGPFPILILQGEKGSGKSTAARVIRLLIDPAKAPLHAGTPTARDLMIRATTNWIVAFDNVSGLSGRFSDVLCQLSTGAGFGTRRLYTDDEEVIFDAMRPVLLNGIADIATRPDLLSRAIVIELPVLDEALIEPEAEFWGRLEEAGARILGGLLDVLAGALALLPEIELDRSPRMADFARIGVAVERTLGWPEGSLLAAYSGREAEAYTAALDAEPVAAVLLRFMELPPQLDGWNGTATELLAKLTQLADDDVTRRRNWPTSASVLGKRLKDLLPALRQVGLEIDKAASGRGRDKQRGLWIYWATRPGDAGDGGDA